MGASILTAHVRSRSELVPIVRAALDIDIVYVALPSAPAPGKHTLQLWLGNDLVAAVLAEGVGSGRAGAYPLRVRPLDPAHIPELEALASMRSEMPVAHPSLSVDEPHPLGPAAEDRTLTSHGAPPAHVDEADEVDATIPSASLGSATIPSARVFSPDAPVSSEPPGPGHADEATLVFEPKSKRPESSTMPGAPRPESVRTPGAVSWNVRVASPEKDPLCGRVIGSGKYVLDSVIGSGAIGIVYKASHRDLGRTVAIKILNPRYRDEPDLLRVFRSEARAASQLEHANVARVYDFGQEPDGLVYIVMEYLSGYTLGSVLGARRKLTNARAVDVMLQVCAALSSAHDRGIVHRDVKPDNIVLVPAQDDEGEPVEIVKVCDFGIAALARRSSDRGGQESYAAGTPEYMSPEQATGGAVSPASDVYACGVVLYEMVTGTVPFTADQPYRVVMKHANEPPRAPSELEPGVPPKLEAVIMKALEKVPAGRYQTAREMRLGLRKAL